MKKISRDIVPLILGHPVFFSFLFLALSLFSLPHNDFPPTSAPVRRIPLASSLPPHHRRRAFENLNLHREPPLRGMTPGTGPREPLKDPSNLTRVIVISCVREGDVTSRHRVWLFRSNEIGFVTTRCVRCARLFSLFLSLSLSLSCSLSSLLETVTFTRVSVSILIRLREDFDYLHSSSSSVRAYFEAGKITDAISVSRACRNSTIYYQLLVFLRRYGIEFFCYVRVFLKRENIYNWCCPKWDSCSESLRPIP